jgi:hypothetical protein
MIVGHPPAVIFFLSSERTSVSAPMRPETRASTMATNLSDSSAAYTVPPVRATATMYCLMGNG